MPHLHRVVNLSILLLAVLGTSTADVVTLNDGSRLLGKVTRLQDDKIMLETEFAGTLEIDATLIDSITTDDPVNVGVDTGDRLVGPIEWRPEVQRAVVQTELGGVPVDLARIDAIWPKDGKSPETLAMEQQIEEVRKEAEAKAGKWSATVEIGLLYQEGNTDKFTARGGFEIRKKSVKDLLRFYLTGEYSEENQRRDTAEVIGGAYYEYLFTERFYWFGASELEYDEFENIDLRVTLSTGPGYYWIKQDVHELKTRAGIGYLHETYNDGTDRDDAQAEVGLNYRLDITPWMRLTNDTTWYPTFESINDYRLNSDTGLIFPIGNSEVWKLKLGARYEYKSIPAGNAERLDQTYYANVLLDIE